MKPVSPKFVSPSRLARFYFQECERYLRFSRTPKELLGTEGVPSAPYGYRPITQAIFEGGFVWEEEVVGHLLEGRVRVAAPGDSPDLRDRIFPAAEAREIITALSPGELVYQPTLSVPDRFYEQYRIDPSVVQFTDSSSSTASTGSTCRSHEPGLRRSCSCLSR